MKSLFGIETIYNTKKPLTKERILAKIICNRIKDETSRLL